MPRAIQITEFGGPEKLQLVDLEVGQPGPGEIRIRHHACGLNFIDVYQRTGLYPNAAAADAGHGRRRHRRGRGRRCHAPEGRRPRRLRQQPARSYSEVRVMPAKTVVKLPDGIAFDTAAGMMLKGLTAQYLLKKTLPVEGLQPGDHVLFHAAAGGVGLIACQWAKALGLQLIGTAGAAKCRLALEHGAAHVIDYTKEDFVARVKDITGGKGVKVVYDRSARTPSRAA
jgi:NADPH2:quinone reductase